MSHVDYAFLLISEHIFKSVLQFLLFSGDTSQELKKVILILKAQYVWKLLVKQQIWNVA